MGTKVSMTLTIDGALMSKILRRAEEEKRTASEMIAILVEQALDNPNLAQPSR